MDVLIVDDHPIIHETLGAVVKRALPGATVRAEKDLAGAIDCARRLNKLELVLLDLGLPGCTGIEALRRFRKALPRARVAVVSATEDPACMRSALEAGAVGYILKTSAPSVMVAAVRLISEGGTYVPPEAMSGAPDAVGLTERQADVLRLLMKGLPNRQIAERLDIAENTVKQHPHAVYKALGVLSRTEAIVAAARRGIKLE